VGHETPEMIAPSPGLANCWVTQIFPVQRSTTGKGGESPPVSPEPVAVQASVEEHDTAVNLSMATPGGWVGCADQVLPFQPSAHGTGFGQTSRQAWPTASHALDDTQATPGS